jgi:regulator of CtrA degradation
MPAQDACDEKYRIAALNADGTEKPQALPGGLLNLLDRSNRLYERISHMDKRMFIDGEAEEITVNPVMSQMAMLQNAFALEGLNGQEA